MSSGSVPDIHFASSAAAGCGYSLFLSIHNINTSDKNTYITFQFKTISYKYDLGCR